MIIYPSIDIKDGAVVRLVRGETEPVPLTKATPCEQAALFRKQGFSWVHVVDLDGALSGTQRNKALVEEILTQVDLPVQLGGGIRTIEQVETWLERGVARIVLGTAALRDAALVREACRRFPGKIAVSIDAREGRVSVSGWAEETEMRALDLALRYEDAGVAAVIYTDIRRDGVSACVNIEATVDLAFALTTPVIAAGGVAGIQDLRELKHYEHAGIDGVVVGRALHNGDLDIEAALAEMAALAPDQKGAQ